MTHFSAIGQGIGATCDLVATAREVGQINWGCIRRAAATVTRLRGVLRVDETAQAVGKALGRLTLLTESAVAAVIRAGQLLIPKPDLVLRAHDEVPVLIHAGDVGQHWHC